MTAEARIKELLANEEFLAALLEMESPEQVQAALKEQDVELEIADIEMIQKLVENPPEEGELSDDDLEQVAGGSITVGAAIGIAFAVVSGVAKLAIKVNEWTRRRW